MSFDKFINAVKTDNLNAVKLGFRLEYLDQFDGNGFLPIHVACRSNSLEIFKFFINQNCNIESADVNGWRPIHHAVSNMNLDIIRILIGHGCELTKDDETLTNLVKQTNREDITNTIDKAKNNMKIGKEMQLKCSLDCDHKLCLQSFCLNEFDQGSFVNSGIYGKITKLKESQSTHREFAIKKISWKPIVNDVEGNVQKEAKYVEYNINEHRSKLIHKRIVKYYGAIINGYKMFIFMEYMPGGSIDQLIYEFNDGLPEEKIWKYSQQILEGLDFLHTNKIIHRDIKPANVLLDKEKENCKLTDMGFSRLMENINKYSNKSSKSSSSKSIKERSVKAETKCGTANYMAPEVINGSPYSYECDIWSLGATVFEMLTGYPPFHGEKQNSVFMSIGKGNRPKYPDTKLNSSKKVISFIDEMFNLNILERPTAKTLLLQYFDKNTFV